VVIGLALALADPDSRQRTFGRSGRRGRLPRSFLKVTLPGR
jgi:hypothetical protein